MEFTIKSLGKDRISYPSMDTRSAVDKQSNSGIGRCIARGFDPSMFPQ